jgi:hypothetical protein
MKRKIIVLVIIQGWVLCKINSFVQQKYIIDYKTTQFSKFGIGGAYFLNRLPDDSGLFLSLTGACLSGYHALALGLADGMVFSKKDKRSSAAYRGWVKARMRKRTSKRLRGYLALA